MLSKEVEMQVVVKEAINIDVQISANVTDNSVEDLSVQLIIKEATVDVTEFFRDVAEAYLKRGNKNEK